MITELTAGKLDIQTNVSFQNPPLVYAIPPPSRQALAFPARVFTDVITAPLSSQAVKGRRTFKLTSPSIHAQAEAGQGAEQGTKHALTHSIGSSTRDSAIKSRFQASHHLAQSSLSHLSQSIACRLPTQLPGAARLGWPLHQAINQLLKQVARLPR